jgi:hypothetical protein
MASELLDEGNVSGILLPSRMETIEYIRYRISVSFLFNSYAWKVLKGILSSLLRSNPLPATSILEMLAMKGFL